MRSHTPLQPTQPSTYPPSSPAQPSNPNTNHTTTSGTKPTTAIEAITDPEFLPTLDDAPTVRKAQSRLLLLSLVVGGVFLAWVMGFELFQFEEKTGWGVVLLGLSGVVGGGWGLLVWTGSHNIDWWELVAGYWWLSMPVAGAAGLLFIMGQEQTTELNELD